MLTPLRSAVLALLLAFQLLLPACADASRPLGIGLNHHRGGILGGGQIGGGGISAVSYDTSIGNGVDTNGRADLTPRGPAQEFYTNSTTGSDSNTCTQAKSAATPKATIKSAVTCVVDGEGDHVLIAQGMSYPNGFASVGDKGGFSAQYPVVYQSYDPADPTNQAKWGTATGSNRPDINMSSGTDNSGGFIQGSGASRSYFAFRGLKFNGNNASAVAMNVLPHTTGIFNYLLFENDEFAQVQLSVEGDEAAGAIRTFSKLILRSVSSHGQWDSSGGGRAQGFYVQTGDGVTVEDSVLWRAGWKEGALRTDSTASGGPSNQAHSLYFQDDVRNAVVRRSAFIDNSAEGVGNLKGGAVVTDNLIIHNPIAASTGGGNNYTIDAPLGVYSDMAYNMVVGAGPSTDTGDWGLHLMNARPIGSAVHHNALVRSGVAGAYALMIDAANDLITDPTFHSGWSPNTTAAQANPSTGSFYNNVSYLWSPSGQTKGIGQSGGNLGLITSSFNNNIWDDPTSGTNTNNGSATFANAYTESSLLLALSPTYTTEAIAVADWVAHPDQHGWRNGPTLGLAGYGVTKSLTDLVTDMRLTAGVANSGQFLNVLDGYAISGTGLPSCVTVDSDGRAWRADTSCTVSSGSATIAETNGASSHNTSLPWTVYAAPVLSSLTVTPSTTTASATVSVNVGSGNLYWMATSKSGIPPWPYLKQGIDADIGSAGIKYGSQAISATGSQSISGISGLTTSTAYYLDVFQLDANNNPSLVSQASFTTTGSSFPASLGSNLVLDFTNLSMSNVYTDTGATTNVSADGQTVKAIKDPTSGIIFTNSTGWVYHANSGKPYLAMDGASTFASTTAVTFADATGQYAIWAAVNVSSSASAMELVTTSSGNQLFTPNASNGSMNLIVRSASAQLAGAWSAGVSLNTDQVYSGLSKGTSGTSGTAEAFVNNADTPGSGVVAWSGTPLISSGLWLNPPTTVAGKFYGLLMAKGDQTANLSAAQTYMAALHP